MPIWITQEIKAGLNYSVWEITEDEPTLFSYLKDYYSPIDFSYLKHEKKRLQWLAARVLLKQMCDQLNIPFEGTFKNEFGKVYLKNSTIEISITHSDKHAAIAINEHGKVGIDLESISNKPARIAKKFMSYRELEECKKDNSDFTYYWTAKEAVYKWYGKKKVIFNTQIAILKNQSKAILNIDEEINNLYLFGRNFDDMQLLVAY